MTQVITIDGPSGAGKGTICQLVAQALGYHLLDSGALYRLTALAVLREGVRVEDEAAVAFIAANLDVQFQATATGVVVVLAGDDVTQTIRQEHVGMQASVVAAMPLVRKALLQRQRNFAQIPGLVADGRDMGTTVFPDAQVKVFLTASAKARAERRIKQLELSGAEFDAEAVLDDIVRRDESDRERISSPLKPAEDAITIDCTDLTIEQVLNQVLELAKES